MFGRIVNRECPVVVLFATHRIARERQSVGESGVEHDLFATQSRRGRQGRDLVKRPFELLRPFKKRGSRQRALSRSAPKTDRLLDQARLSAVARQQLGLTLSDIGELALEGFSDAGVQGTTRLAQQRAVSGVLHESMLKQIGRVRWYALPK